MNKLFGLFLLALACWAPVRADAATRFAVCTTTCTWDNTSTAMWSASSGGATGQSAPVNGDTVTFDAATCVGGTTCTITTFAGTIAFTSIDFSACTASTAGCIIDASANNTNFNISLNSGAPAVNGSGTGTRTLNMGSGTWTLSGTTATFTISNSTGLTFVGASSTLAFTGSGPKTLIGSSKTFGTVTAAASSSTGSFSMTQSATMAALTIAAPNTVLNGNGTTATVTTLSVTGSSASAPVGFISNAINNGTMAFAVTNNFTCTWCAFASVVFSGGTHTANSSFSFSNTSGITVNAPSAGGGGGGRIIGG